MNDDDDDETYLTRIRQLLTQTKAEPAKSRTIVELFRRFFSSDASEDKLEGTDCVQGRYHEIVPRLYLGDW